MNFVEKVTFPKCSLSLLIAATLLALLLIGCQFQLVQPVGTTPETSAESTPTPMAEPDLMAGIPLTQALPPVALRIPALNLDLPVATMGWVVTEVNVQGVISRTTEWVLPTDSVGWHANSAGAGGAGNTIFSGYQAAGAAVLAPLALGDIVVGQEIELVDTAGNVFRYQVVEVSEPIGLLGATEEANTLMRSYVQPSEQPILTLMTGWPDFTTTHRIFAVAEYVGRAS